MGVVTAQVMEDHGDDPRVLVVQVVRLMPSRTSRQVAVVSHHLLAKFAWPLAYVAGGGSVALQLFLWRRRCHRLWIFVRPAELLGERMQVRYEILWRVLFSLHLLSIALIPRERLVVATLYVVSNAVRSVTLVYVRRLLRARADTQSPRIYGIICLSASHYLPQVYVGKTDPHITGRIK